MSQWDNIGELYQRYIALAADDVDFSKYHAYSIIAHSTAIEGSTLTEEDTQLLLEYGSTIGGKPIHHHLMAIDLKRAYDEVYRLSREDFYLSPERLQRLNSLVLHSTGGVYNQIGGTYDASKGEFRLGGANAGPGRRSYPHYLKIPAKIAELCNELNTRYPKATSLQEIYELSFLAHLLLVDLHPWADGNGRSSRLLMNYIQIAKGVLPSIVYESSRSEYIAALRATDETESSEPFIRFMSDQFEQFLAEQTALIEQRHSKEDKGRNLL